MKGYMGRVMLLIGILLLASGGWFYYQNLRGIGPAIGQPSQSMADFFPPATDNLPAVSFVAQNLLGMPLKLPTGFEISLFAKDLPGARVLVKDRLGNFWVSQPGKGIVSQLQVVDGKVTDVHPVFRGLKNPHGLALNPDSPLQLYIAEEDKISRVGLYGDGRLEKIADLPAGGVHTTRTIGFGPDGRLYAASGSTCNACQEKDERRAAIISMNKDGSDMKTVATGLRNSVFFTWSDTDKRMWATDNGRDLLGDNLPPDEVNVIETGKFYGWPFCYGANVQDMKFDASASAAQRCQSSISPLIEIQAHSAPLGLAFVPASSAWPQEYWHDLFVAYHGSWNRSQPTGYKIVRWKLDAKGNVEGQEDFLTGFLVNGEALGRPVALQVEEDGTMYVTDDKAGVVYSIHHITP